MTSTLYLTVVSDASHGLYPDNTSSKFRGRLPRPVDLLELLQGPWEVGLCELTYAKPANGAELLTIIVYRDDSAAIVKEHARRPSSPKDTTSSKTCITCLWTNRTSIPSP